MAESLRTWPTAEAATAVPRWYACYTRARHEKRVERMLQDRGVETFLPLAVRVSQWKDRRKAVDWPLFPSYVFGRFDLQDVHKVLGIPGVVSLVKSDGRPVPIDDGELENVRRFVQILRTGGVEAESRPLPLFGAGDAVEVVAGPCAGLRGVVVESRGRRRVLIGLHAIGQGLEVHIDPKNLRAAPGSDEPVT
jgi:transcription antitermination factor NusG